MRPLQIAMHITHAMHSNEHHAITDAGFWPCANNNLDREFHC